MTSPGQGAQKPGFLAPWLDLAGVTELLGEWSDLAQCDLIRYGTTASLSELTDTAVAQPLLVAAALAVVRQLPAPGAAAGHSVGELAAAAIAGMISEQGAMVLAGVRGRAMARAAKRQPTGMIAVLGGDQAAVLAAAQRHGLTLANLNSPGQVVLGGTVDQLRAFSASPPSAAALRTLPVMGAFHTPHMASAAVAFGAALADAPVTDPALVVLSNADGTVITSGRDWAERIVTQVAAPVRWDRCMATMSTLGVTALIELPPAGTLTALAKRWLPGVRLLALKTTDQLDVARSLLDEHVSSPAAVSKGRAPAADRRLGAFQAPVRRDG